LGKAVLRALFEVAKAHDCTDAWVLTNRSNAAAMALYSSVGGTEGADDAWPSDATLGYLFALTDVCKHGPSN
jgi:ribosomal protein S18 acetylase RimI-like enzyme